MLSSDWGVPAGGAAGRVLAALDRLDPCLDDAWVAPKGSLNAEETGVLIARVRARKARLEALELALVRQAEACDIGQLTGAPNATVYLRTAQRLGAREASQTVGLARDLDGKVRLTGVALAAGVVSVKQAQKIAEVIGKLPAYVGVDERHEAEEFLIEAARFANPDELRVLGRKLQERIAPEEYYRQMGKELERKDRKAEQKRSLRYVPNGIPQSESVHITLPAWEMELLRKLIEPLAEPVKGADPDHRPIDQRRGDAFAEAIGLLAAAATAPTRGGRPPQVAVTIPFETLLKGTGAGTIDDTATVVRPRPCTCPCKDPKYATTKNTRKSGKDYSARDGGASDGNTGGGSAATSGCSKHQAGKENHRPPGTGSPAGGIPPLREPGHHPQPHTEPESEPEPATGRVPATEPDPEGNPDLGADAGLGADAEAEQGAAGSEAATEPFEPIDPHDGCSKCGGGGSARYLGADGKPISAATVRRLACEADLIPVVLAGDGQVLDLGRSDRFFKEHQRRALAIRDGSHCHFPGCQIPEPRCVTHHMTAWDHGGPTNLANGVLLCRYHHSTVHHKGWLVRMGTHGHPEYVPPEWSDPQRRVLRP